jgi:hypothetical protein
MATSRTFEVMDIINENQSFIMLSDQLSHIMKLESLIVTQHVHFCMAHKAVFK